MRLHSALISSFLLGSAVLAQDTEWTGAGVTLIGQNNGTFRTVMAGMKVHMLSGGNDDSVTAVVSLDPTGCPDSVFVGVTCSVYAPAETRCGAWYSAKPGLRAEISDFPIEIGDTIYFGVTAPYFYATDPSIADGVAVFFDKVNSSLSHKESFGNYKACGQQAGWAVSNTPDPAKPGYYLPVARFGRFELLSAVAYGLEGDMHGPSGDMAHHYKMISSNGSVIAALDVEGNSVVATDIRPANPN